MKSVGALMGCGFRCLKCVVDIPSGPVKEVFLVALIAFVTNAEVKSCSVQV